MRYGHADFAAAIEIVSARLRGIVCTEKPSLKPTRKRNIQPQPVATILTRLAKKAERLPVYEREHLPVGFAAAQPMLIVEYGSTTLVPSGWHVEVDQWKNLILHK